jgi:peptidoglycan/LPS O-acetylase OafA/YrhL
MTLSSQAGWTAGPAAPAMREPDRLVVLDSIRGLAAFIVVIHHCLLTQPAFCEFFFSSWRVKASTGPQWLLFDTPLRLLWGGSEAVTLFYILSGLVLALPWVEGRAPRYAAYCIRRICRLYLPYCAAVAIAAGLAVWLQSRAVVPELSRWVNEMNWTHQVTPAVLLDHAVMLGHRNTLNGVIHTLIWEMRASLLFPLLIVPIVRWRLRGAVAVTLALWAAVCGLQLAYGAGGSPLDFIAWQPGMSKLGQLAIEVQGTAYYCTFFVYGSMLALNIPAIRRLSSGAAMALLAAGLLTLQGHWSYTLAVQDFMTAAGAVMIICSALPNGVVHRALSLRWLQWLGRMSFSLYLVHSPLLLASVILFGRDLPVAAILIAVPFASLVVASLFNAAVVEPSAQLGRTLAKARFHFPRLIARRSAGSADDTSRLHAGNGIVRTQESGY